MKLSSSLATFWLPTLLLSALSCSGVEAAPTKPNVLLIMADDQGWGDVASHGARHLRTPVLDSLAESGVRFERFFVSPVCAPTRASLLTGRYSLRTGVRGVTRGWENMRTEEHTIAESLRAAGYATGCFGKWHVESPETRQWKATLLFACKPEDAGCRFRISCGDSELEFVLPESHQRDFKHSTERVPPSPHYAVRTWRELSLGFLSLSHGHHDIRIVGLNRPGSRFAEINSLKLSPAPTASNH